MPDQLTATGTTGPGKALTATVFTPLFKLGLDCENNVLEVVYGVPRKTQYLEYGTLITVTVTHTLNGPTTAVVSTS